MSQHSIENLIEDSVYLINKSDLSASEKRNSIVNLYRFQAQFDTGYTHFRCIDILLKNKATYRIPLTEHPDYSNHTSFFDNLDGYWLPADVSKPNDTSVFFNEDDQHLYFDAGTALWQRLKAQGRIHDVTPASWDNALLVHNLLELAAKTNHADVFSQWYALALNEVLIGSTPDFMSWLKNKDIQAIRVLLVRYKSLITNKTGYLETKRYAASTIIKNHSYLGLDAKFKVRYLMELNNEDEEIIAKYQEQLNKQNRVKVVFDYACAQTILTLEDNGWHILKEDKENNKTVFSCMPRHLEDYPLTEQSGVLPLLFIAIDAELKTMSASFGLKYALMMRWQKATTWEQVAALGSDVGSTFLSQMLSENEQQHNKNLHKTYVGWKISPQKQFDKSIKDLMSHLQTVLPNFIKKHDAHWFEQLLSQDPVIDESQKQFQKLPGKFFIRWHLVLLHAFMLYEKGKKEEAKQWAQRFLGYTSTVKNFNWMGYKPSVQSILDDAPFLQALY